MMQWSKRYVKRGPKGSLWGSVRALNVTVETAKVKFAYDILLSIVSVRVPAENRCHTQCLRVNKRAIYTLTGIRETSKGQPAKHSRTSDSQGASCQPLGLKGQEESRFPVLTIQR